jgi:formylglycine-generating enzyme required for sulfatase activity
VGGKPETAFGLVDMAGNAAEWTADFYGETFAACGSEPCLNPKGPIEGDARVIRGGAFDDLFASSFRSAKRDKEDPWATSPAVGGRCVKR